MMTEDRIPAPQPAPQLGPDEAQANAAREARDLLSATDFVVIKAAEGVAALTPEWLAWREDLRRVVRGELNDIPGEPARYA